MNNELIGSGRTADVFSWGEGKILKLFRDFMPRFEVENEFNVSQAAHAAGISTPKPLELLETQDRLGIVYQRLQGQTMLDAIKSLPATGLRQAHELARLHYKLHQTQNHHLATQKNLLKRNINYTPALDMQKKTIILRYLDGLDEGDAVCHGDFHPDNILIANNTYWIIDWMTASRGCPAADVARTMLILKTGCPKGASFIESKLLQFASFIFRREYLREYRKLSGLTMKDIRAWILPLAAARLTENLPVEELHQVLGIIDREIKRMKLRG